jgi:hypothetical protein
LKSCVITLLGAPCRGKTALAFGLQRALSAAGHRTALVSDLSADASEAADAALRPGDPSLTADAQSRAIDRAARGHEVVVALAAALPAAVATPPSTAADAVDADTHRAQGRGPLHLLYAPHADAASTDLQDPGLPAREALDAALRSALHACAVAYGVLTGTPGQRLDSALAAAQRALSPPAAASRWRWVCERCGEGACERHLLPSV